MKMLVLKSLLSSINDHWSLKLKLLEEWLTSDRTCSVSLLCLIMSVVAYSIHKAGLLHFLFSAKNRSLGTWTHLINLGSPSGRDMCPLPKIEKVFQFKDGLCNFCNWYACRQVQIGCCYADSHLTVKSN